MHGVLAHDELYTRLQVPTVTQAVAAGWIEVYATVAGSKLRRSAGQRCLLVLGCRVDELSVGALDAPAHLAEVVDAPGVAALVVAFPLEHLGDERLGELRLGA